MISKEEQPATTVDLYAAQDVNKASMVAVFKVDSGEFVDVWGTKDALLLWPGIEFLAFYFVYYKFSDM